ncbi:MAG: molybdopterin biosynthesis protein, partial [Planctomycetes bacterium]|nr:molybdopterin biosynthesis protein [Planctomycetota bacterium]
MTDTHNVRAAARQHQFLDVVGRDVAVERFQKHLAMKPLGTECVQLADCLDRVLAEDVVAAVDVSGFDRSNVDGFALQSADTYGAMEERPTTVSLNAEVLAPGIPPQQSVLPGTATTIATGGMLPRGADAVVMVEDTELIERGGDDDGGDDDDGGGDRLLVTRAVAPGGNVTFAGTDVAKGETVLRAGRLLTSREIGVLAAIGCCEANVFRRPKIAIISTGNEIVPPGEDRPPGFVYDSNLAILSAAVRELGAEPVPLGVVGDDEERLQEFLDRGLAYDGVVLSGGTSKGAGDLTYRVVSRLKNPGVVVHGVALKPGKPICLAVTDGKPVVVLPGFPTSAIFTFHEFVAPVIRALAGRKPQSREWVTARLPVRVNSDRGRTEYLPVGLMNAEEGLAAYWMGKCSGSVTTF